MTLQQLEQEERLGHPDDNTPAGSLAETARGVRGLALCTAEESDASVRRQLFALLRCSAASLLSERDAQAREASEERTQHSEHTENDAASHPALRALAA